MLSKKTTSYIQRHSFWMVLLCHCLLFAGISFEWAASTKLFKMEEKDRPSLFIPSYVSHDKTMPAMQEKMAAETKTVPTSKMGIEKPAKIARPAFNTNHPIDISRAPQTEPVHLIGDKKIDRPLLTLLGKALTKHLIYPKSAIDLNVKGTSIIGFLLYPDGHVTNVQLLQSSRAAVLDKAALMAANAISPVNQVSQYLDKPKFMVIGIIFQ
jgi:TonB family protein